MEAELLVTLGGPGARKFLDGGVHADTYWLRVWGARGVLWAWDASATEAIRAALEDDAWRVREMAAKVVARHRIDDALDRVAALVDDPAPRVRVAATRALVRLTTVA
ncbi:MAG TPA: HEAT repeat domain-containing protein [Nocardioidaceae bacterium]|nr:HEAT repeat domain-containing protein [Nocardioidaceae bacterium]